MENRAERKYVRTVIEGLRPNLLRRHIPRGAHDPARIGHRSAGIRRPGSSGKLGKAEIQDLDPTLGRDPEILRFQIAMDDVFLMGRGQPLRYLDSVIERQSLRQALAETIHLPAGDQRGLPTDGLIAMAREEGCTVCRRQERALSSGSTFFDF